MYDENGEQRTVFYSEGSKELREGRLKIAKYSLPRAQLRVDKERQAQDVEARIQEVEECVNSIGSYVVQESQYADDRCVARGCLSPDEEFFATSGWSGICRVWGVPDC